MQKKNRKAIISITIALWLVALMTHSDIFLFLANISFCLLAIPFVHGFLGKLCITVNITSQDKVYISGESACIGCTIQNTSFLAFPVVVFESPFNENISNIELQKRTMFLNSKESRRIDFIVECKRRGVYTLGNTNLVIHDLYNFWTFKKKCESKISLTVYPKIVPLHTMRINATRHSGEISVFDPLFRDHSELRSLKRFKDGDTLKHVHWKASARNDFLLVKEYEMKGDSDITLFVNAVSLDYGHDKDKKIEDEIVLLIVSILNYLFQKSLKVSLTIANPNLVERIEGHDSSDLNIFLKLLANFSPKLGNKSFVEILKESTRFFKQGSSVFVITPTIDKKIAREIIELKMQNKNPELFIVSNANYITPKAIEIQKILKILESEKIPVHNVSTVEAMHEAN